MTVGSFCLFEEASAHVSGCDCLGEGSRIAANCEVTSGSPSVGPQEVVYGPSKRAYDSNAISVRAEGGPSVLDVPLEYLKDVHRLGSEGSYSTELVQMHLGGSFLACGNRKA
ncbi:hypothetical protein cyc_01379 [Cyclospora cayetanensis]|uniref:Uncharacterized protein n=1 Tax=Cyclospora cayetanensis TaxID=88456 RepID=A0A1D3CXW8_9EIME|nr:hypothetical protein cyc_01379 [Cyclospora cayetanensis]